MVVQCKDVAVCSRVVFTLDLGCVCLCVVLEASV